MAVEVRDVIRAHLLIYGVSLLSNLEDVEAFRSASKAEDLVLTQGAVQALPKGAVEPALTLSLSKERISVVITPTTSRVFREYPEDIGALDRLAEIARYAIECSTPSDLNPTGFSFLMELVYDQSSGLPAAQYVAHRVVAPDIAKDEEWSLDAGSVVLEYTEGGGNRRRVINLEPRTPAEDEAKVLLRFSDHFAEQCVPGGDTILSSLQTAWHKAHTLIEWLDGRK